MQDKKFDMKNWRQLLSEKIGIRISQLKAAILLGYTEDTIIRKIEKGIVQPTKQMIMLAEMRLSQSVEDLKKILNVQ